MEQVCGRNTALACTVWYGVTAWRGVSLANSLVKMNETQWGGRMQSIMARDDTAIEFAQQAYDSIAALADKGRLQQALWPFHRACIRRP